MNVKAVQNRIGSTMVTTWPRNPGTRPIVCCFIAKKKKGSSYTAQPLEITGWGTRIRT